MDRVVNSKKLNKYYIFFTTNWEYTELNKTHILSRTGTTLGRFNQLLALQSSHIYARVKWFATERARDNCKRDKYARASTFNLYLYNKIIGEVEVQLFECDDDDQIKTGDVWAPKLYYSFIVTCVAL